MRVAQVAPLYESVPPKRYGGTERIVSYLTEELVRQGHEVTLFASGDSVTQARLVAPCERALRMAGVPDPLAHHMILLDLVREHSADFDVIHHHVDYLHFPSSQCIGTPRLTTLHGRLDLPDLQPLYRRFHREPLVSISDAQRRPLPFANWLCTVHHGMTAKPTVFRPRADDEGYLAFVGRVSPEKGPAVAIEIARRAGRKLKLAAKVDAADRDYHERVLLPLIAENGVDFLDEIDERGRDELVAGAAALLFPIDWPEPFGLVMIEALACGTPVIAFRRGSVAEIIEDGVSGFVCGSIEEAVAAVARVGSISRAACRKAFDTRFRTERMVADYVRLYERLAQGRDAGRAA